VTKVKICGLTRVDDAIMALEAGADFLGFILYPPSPRAITPEELAELTSELRNNPQTREIFGRPAPPLLVGVFVNESTEAMSRLLETCGLDLAQLSGDEPAEMVSSPDSPLFGRAYKAIRPRTAAEAVDQSTRYAISTAVRPRLLLDTPHGRLYGGTGETGDWSLAATLAAAVPGVMLAGGLTPDNVAEAVRRARPFAVDVASGVELSPGRKDAKLVRAFIANAKRGASP